MNIEGLIATPFGYILDGLYHLTSNYGITLILFAMIVQAIMVPINMWNKKNSEKKRKLQPQIARIRLDYKDDVDKQTELITALYDSEKVSLMGGYIMTVLPFFILVPIFQSVAQPITYLLHEAPETVDKIVSVMKETAPELFNSSYTEVAAITHIKEYAALIQEKVPEVSVRTLEGLNYTFLGLNLCSVPMFDVFPSWQWDWAHIGVIALPIVYQARRIYMIFSTMAKSLVSYSKAKKQALADGKEPPKMPNPPLLQLIFMVMSITAMFAIPVAMCLYWLAGGLAASCYRKAFARKVTVPCAEAPAKQATAAAAELNSPKNDAGCDKATEGNV